MGLSKDVTSSKLFDVNILLELAKRKAEMVE
jgi:hypothetical protein